jgi:hypothetical protein
VSTSCVRTACSQLLQQVWNKLLTTCNKLDDIIRLVTRLFLQVWYNHDITRMLQVWRHKVVTILLYHMTVSDLLEQRCHKSDVTKLAVLQVVNSLFQNCWQLGTSSANTTCSWLVSRLATRCEIFACVWLQLSVQSSVHWTEHACMSRGASRPLKFFDVVSWSIFASKCLFEVVNIQPKKLKTKWKGKIDATTVHTN